MVNPLLDGFPLPAQIIATVPYPTWLSLCCFPLSSYCCLVRSPWWSFSCEQFSHRLCLEPSTGNSSDAISILDCQETYTASGLRLVSTMLGKTSYLDPLWVPSYFLCPAMMYVLPILCQLQIHPVPKFYLSLLRVFWSFPSPLYHHHISHRGTLSCRHLHVYLPWVRATWHPEKYAPCSLSFYTA